MRYLLALLTTVALSTPSLAGSGGDVPEPVKKFIEKAIPKKFNLVEVKPTGKKYELEEFKLWFRNDVMGFEYPGYLFYDRKNGAIFVGSRVVFRNGKQVNLSRESMQREKKYIHYDLSKVDLKKCVKIGDKGRKIIMVTDPTCPHCKKLFSDVQKIAKEGKAVFYVLLYPVHGDRSRTLIAYILSQPSEKQEKALEEVFNAKPKELKKLEEKGKELLKDKDVKELVEYHKKTVDSYKAYATPTFFLPDGTKEVGFMKRTKEILGIEEQKSKGDKR